MQVLVVTIVHTPLDARIFRRQIGALLAAGSNVTYAAPFSATSTPPPELAGLRTVDLPRARGRRRLAASRAARRCIATLGRRADLVLLHDPELTLAVAGQLRRLPPVVLDVHEDTAASLIDRPWVPRWLRPMTASATRGVERWAERRLHLLLAERSYQDRFRRPHPFVPNVPPRPTDDPPPPGDRRVVYLGRIARSRGALEMLEVAAQLHDEVDVELIGPVDDDVRRHLDRAVTQGHVRWGGFVPNDLALPRLDGALAGLSLVHPQPNHAGSLQTKVLEYLSRGVPVISSDLPVTGPFVRDHDVGLVVPARSPVDVVDAIRQLRTDGARRTAMARRGFELIRDELNWDEEGPRFVGHLRDIAGGSPAGDVPG